jgi:hypothetical protein
MVFPGLLAGFGNPESGENYFSKRAETKSLWKNGKEKSLTDCQKPASHRK